MLQEPYKPLPTVISSSEENSAEDQSSGKIARAITCTLLIALICALLIPMGLTFYKGEKYSQEFDRRMSGLKSLGRSLEHYAKQNGGRFPPAADSSQEALKEVLDKMPASALAKLENFSIAYCTEQNGGGISPQETTFGTPVIFGPLKTPQTGTSLKDVVFDEKILGGAAIVYRSDGSSMLFMLNSEGKLDEWSEPLPSWDDRNNLKICWPK